SRGRGRIWRIVPDDGRKPAKFDLRKGTTAELMAKLRDANAWWRMTAQRLLVERQDRAAAPALEALIASDPQPATRVHALWTLDGLGALTRGHVEKALADASADVREHGLRLSERFFRDSDSLQLAALAKVNDASPRV